MVHFVIDSFNPVEITAPTKSLTFEKIYGSTDVKKVFRLYRNTNDTLTGMELVPFDKITGDARSTLNGITVEFLNEIPAGKYIGMLVFFNDLSNPYQKIGFNSGYEFEAVLALILHMLGFLENSIKRMLSLDTLLELQKPLRFEAGSLLQWNEDSAFIQNLTVENLNRQLLITLAKDFTDKTDLGDESWLIVRDKDGVKVIDIKIKDIAENLQYVEDLKAMLATGQVGDFLVKTGDDTVEFQSKIIPEKLSDLSDVSYLGADVGSVLTLQNDGTSRFEEPYNGSTGGRKEELFFPPKINPNLPNYIKENYEVRNTVYTFDYSIQENDIEIYYVICNATIPLSGNTLYKTTIDFYNMGLIAAGATLKFDVTLLSVDNTVGVPTRQLYDTFTLRFFKGSDENSEMMCYVGIDAIEGVDSYSLDPFRDSKEISFGVVLSQGWKVEVQWYTSPDNAHEAETIYFFYDIENTTGNRIIEIPDTNSTDIIIDMVVPPLSGVSKFKCLPNVVGGSSEMENILKISLLFKNTRYITKDMFITINFSTGVSDNFYKAIRVKCENERDSFVVANMLTSAGVGNLFMTPETVISEGTLKITRKAGIRGISLWSSTLISNPQELTLNIQKKIFNQLQVISSVINDVQLIFPREIFTNRVIKDPVYRTSTFGANTKTNSIPFNMDEPEKPCMVKIEYGAGNNYNFELDSNIAREFIYNNTFNRSKIVENKLGMTQLFDTPKKTLVQIVADMADSHSVAGEIVINEGVGNILAINISNVPNIDKIEYYFSINLQTLCLNSMPSDGFIRIYTNEININTLTVATPFLFEKPFEFESYGTPNTERYNNLDIKFGLIFNKTTANEVPFSGIRKTIPEFDIDDYVKKIDFDAFKTVNTIDIDNAKDLAIATSNMYTDEEIAKNSGADKIVHPITIPNPVWGYRTENYTATKENGRWLESYITAGITNRRLTFQLNMLPMNTWNDGDFYTLKIRIQCIGKFGASNASFRLENQANQSLFPSDLVVRDVANSNGVNISGEIQLSRKNGVSSAVPFMFSANAASSDGSSVDLTDYLKIDDADLIYAKKVDVYDKVQSDALYVMESDFTTFKTDNIQDIDDAKEAAKDYADVGIGEANRDIQNLATAISMIEEVSVDAVLALISTNGKISATKVTESGVEKIKLDYDAAEPPIVENFKSYDWDFDAVTRPLTWLDKQTFTAAEIAFVKNTPPIPEFQVREGITLTLRNFEFYRVRWFDAFGHTADTTLFAKNIPYSNKFGIIIKTNLLSNDFTKVEWSDFTIGTGATAKTTTMFPNASSVSTNAYFKLNNATMNGFNIWLNSISDENIVFRMPICNKYYNNGHAYSTKYILKGDDNNMYVNGSGYWYYASSKISNIIPVKKNYVNDASIVLSDDINENVVCVSKCCWYNGEILKNTDVNSFWYTIILNTSGLTKKIKIILRISYQSYSPFIGSASGTGNVASNGTGTVSNVAIQLRICKNIFSDVITSIVPIYIDTSTDMQILDIPLEIDTTTATVLPSNPFPIVTIP